LLLAERNPWPENARPVAGLPGGTSGGCGRGDDLGEGYLPQNELVRTTGNPRGFIL